MKIQEAVDEFLDKLQLYEQFSGIELQQFVSRKTGRNPFPDSCLRKMRNTRKAMDFKIRCVNNKKSFYRMEL